MVFLCERLGRFFSLCICFLIFFSLFNRAQDGCVRSRCKLPGDIVNLEGVSLCPVYAKRVVEVLRCAGRGLWSGASSWLRVVELCLAVLA